MNVEVKNLSVLQNTQKQLQQTKLSAMTYTTLFGLTLKQTITTNLNQLLGEKMAHFDVNITSEGLRTSVSVQTVDQIGEYIYNGTPPHTIQAGAGTAIPFGDGQFADNVQHPGTAARKPEIDRAVRDAISETKGIMAAFGRAT